MTAVKSVFVNDCDCAGNDYFGETRAVVKGTNTDSFNGVVDTLVGDSRGDVEYSSYAGAVTLVRHVDFHGVWGRVRCNGVVEGLSSATHSAEVL